MAQFVPLPLKDGDVPLLFVCLPEGTSRSPTCQEHQASQQAENTPRSAVEDFVSDPQIASGKLSMEDQ